VLSKHRLLGRAVFVALLAWLPAAATGLITVGALDTPFEGCDAVAFVGRDTGNQFPGGG